MQFTKQEIREAMCLYAVSDSSWLNGRTLPEVIKEAIIGGATFVQLREKHLPYEPFRILAKEVKQITDYYRIPFVINDDVQLAGEIDADGVHIGQNDSALSEARALLGPNKIIGVSAHTVEEAVEAEKQGADYLGVGSVFQTSTKKDVVHISPDILRQICDAVSIPVVAIGGITKDNIAMLKGTHVDGVAVVSAIFAAENIKEDTADMLALSRKLGEQDK